jgi:hypothetical protein
MKLLILFICLATGTLLYAQEPDTMRVWKKGGVFTLTFSQVSLSNWASGGENAISANGLFNGFLNYENKKSKMTWDNTLDLGYGLLKQDKADFRKSDDKIDISSKYGQWAFNKFYYSAIVSFKSQFMPGYNYPNDSISISDFLAPAYIMLALGMDYKPGDNFSFFLSPLTGKFTVVNNQALANAGAFGVEPAIYDAINGSLMSEGKNFRSEIGGYAKLALKQKISESLSLQAKCDLFSNYANNPQNIDVNSELVLAAKLSKYLTATFTAAVVYDDDIDIAVDTNDDGLMDKSGPRTQYKQVIGFGLSIKL